MAEDGVLVNDVLNVRKENVVETKSRRQELRKEGYHVPSVQSFTHP